MPPEQNNTPQFNTQPDKPKTCPRWAKYLGIGIIILLIGVSAFALFKFWPKNTSSELIPTSTSTGQLGGDRDEHGCIGSAGYSWCAAKNKCLRTWEEKCEASPAATTTSGVKGTGQFCGGIAGLKCPVGYECKLDGAYPDAGGKCAIAPAKTPAGTMCIQVVTKAKNAETGEIHDFPTPCHIPEGWEAVK